VRQPTCAAAEDASANDTTSANEELSREAPRPFLKSSVGQDADKSSAEATGSGGRSVRGLTIA